MLEKMKKYTMILLFLFYTLAGYSQSCTNPTGSVISGTYTNYNCHQYVKAALVKGWVNMNSGYPSNQSSISNLSSATIETDNNFIRVCNNYEAKAISMNISQNNADHSAVVLNGGMYSYDYGNLASTPGFGSQVYTHGHARSFTNACSHKFYSTTSNVSISGPSSVSIGATATYTLSAPSNISADHWGVNTSYFDILSSNSTSVTVKAKSSAGSGYVKVYLRTSCMSSGEFKPSKQKTVSVIADCTGTLNGGALYTYNNVSSGASNTVAMNMSSWTWVKTSGSPSYWYTGSGGKYMYFSLSSGCATFNAYNSSCNLTFTFCAYGGYAMQYDGEEQLEYHVHNLLTNQLARKGTAAPADEPEMLKDLPAGLYVLSIGDTKKKVLIK